MDSASVDEAELKIPVLPRPVKDHSKRVSCTNEVVVVVDRVTNAWPAEARTAPLAVVVDYGDHVVPKRSKEFDSSPHGRLVPLPVYGAYEAEVASGDRDDIEDFLDLLALVVDRRWELEEFTRRGCGGGVS